MPGTDEWFLDIGGFGEVCRNVGINKINVFAGADESILNAIGVRQSTKPEFYIRYMQSLPAPQSRNLNESATDSTHVVGI